MNTALVLASEGFGLSPLLWSKLANIPGHAQLSLCSVACAHIYEKWRYPSQSRSFQATQAAGLAPPNRYSRGYGALKQTHG